MKESPVVEKSRRFAVRIVHAYRQIAETRKEFVLSKQILRSGTSIGANIAEAEGAFGMKDFASKMVIAHKECLETLYWLKLLSETGFLEQDDFASLHADCDELRKILASIIITTREKMDLK